MFDVNDSKCGSVKMSEHFLSLSLVQRVFTPTFIISRVASFFLLLVSGSLFSSISCKTHYPTQLSTKFSDELNASIKYIHLIKSTESKLDRCLGELSVVLSQVDRSD